MQQKIKVMKIALIVQIVFGVLATAFITYLLAYLSLDEEVQTTYEVLLGWGIALGLVGVPVVGLPLLALRELVHYSEKKSLTFTYINAAVAPLVGIVLLPIFLVSLVQFYFIYGLRKAEAMERIKSEVEGVS